MDRELSLPITGMTCANCAATVERALRKTEGVQEAAVNYASERASVRFDPLQIDESGLVERISSAGYGVATQRVELPITGMTCANCAATIERTLQARVPGVVSAMVNFATEKAAVEFIPGAVIAASSPRAHQTTTTPMASGPVPIRRRVSRAKTAPIPAVSTNKPAR